MIVQILGLWKKQNRENYTSKTYPPHQLMQEISAAIDKFTPELLNKGVKIAIYANPNKKEHKHPDYNLCLMVPELEKKKKDLDPNNVPF